MTIQKTYQLPRRRRGQKCGRKVNALDVLLVKQNTLIVSFLLFQSFAHASGDRCLDKALGCFSKSRLENDMFSVEFSLVAEKSVRLYFSSLVRVCRQPAFYHVFEPDYPTLRCKGKNADGKRSNKMAAMNDQNS